MGLESEGTMLNTKEKFVTYFIWLQTMTIPAVKWASANAWKWQKIHMQKEKRERLLSHIYHPRQMHGRQMSIRQCKKKEYGNAWKIW